MFLGFFCDAIKGGNDIEVTVDNAAQVGFKVIDDGRYFVAVIPAGMTGVVSDLDVGGHFTDSKGVGHVQVGSVDLKLKTGYSLYYDVGYWEDLDDPIPEFEVTITTEKSFGNRKLWSFKKMYDDLDERAVKEMGQSFADLSFREQWELFIDRYSK